MYQNETLCFFIPLKLTGEEGQQIKGLGGCFNELGHIALSKISKEKQEEIYDALFGPQEG